MNVIKDFSSCMEIIIWCFSLDLFVYYIKLLYLHILNNFYTSDINPINWFHWNIFLIWCCSLGKIFIYYFCIDINVYWSVIFIFVLLLIRLPIDILFHKNNSEVLFHFPCYKIIYVVLALSGYQQVYKSEIFHIYKLTS